MIITHMRVVAGLPGDQARSIDVFLRAIIEALRRMN
jgi:hypothetical protein